MKTATFFLSVVLSSLTLFAQQTGGLAERFKQLDRNGDGKVSREEGGSPARFEAADKDNDGFLTIEEVQSVFARATARPRQSSLRRRNKPVGAAQPPANSRRWTRCSSFACAMSRRARSSTATASGCARSSRRTRTRRVAGMGGQLSAAAEGAGRKTRAGDGQSDETDALDERFPVVLALVQRPGSHQRAARQSRLPGTDEGRQRQHDARPR